MKGILIFLLCFCCALSYAQKDKSTNIQAQRKYNAADEALNYDLYDRAISELQAAIKIDPKFAAAYQRIGDINRKLKRYEPAAIAYKKVLEIVPEYDQRTYYGLAQSELYTGNYASALEHFKKFQNWPNQTEANKRLVVREILNCEFSIEAIKKPVAFNPKNLGAQVNTSQEEYLPVVTADEKTLIFTRRSNDNEDFFSSTSLNNDWTAAKYLSANINTSMFNEGAQCISPDGMYLFFTGCNRPDGAGKCDIYVCKREGKDWSKPFNLGAPINTRGWDTQPSISANGRTLCFVSDRPGGLGGDDIWKTELQSEGWSAPVNLGPTVNTRFNEHSPFIHHDDNTLYFASDGWPGLGNKDLFISIEDGTGKFGKAKNLGYPINTHGEEKGLTISSNGKKAYFSSNAKGGFGGMDIYSFDLAPELRPGIVTYVKGKVFDAKTQEPLDANVKITALKTNVVAFEDVSDAENGEFLATMALSGKLFGLSVNKPGYLLHSESFVLEKPEAADKPFSISIPLNKIEAGGLMVLKNIFFETNKFELLPESKTELEQLISFLTDNPSVMIEIGGHTDNVGNELVNQTLSENRAKTVYNYLIEKKVAAARLTYKGYGKTKPIAANTSEDGRQQNRRTEFKITRP